MNSQVSEASDHNKGNKQIVVKQPSPQQFLSSQKHVIKRVVVDFEKLKQSGLDRKLAEALSKQKKLTATKSNGMSTIMATPTKTSGEGQEKVEATSTTIGEVGQRTTVPPKNANSSQLTKKMIPPKITITKPTDCAYPAVSQICSSTSGQSTLEYMSSADRMTHVKYLLKKNVLLKQQAFKIPKANIEGARRRASPLTLTTKSKQPAEILIHSNKYRSALQQRALRNYVVQMDDDRECGNVIQHNRSCNSHSTQDQTANENSEIITNAGSSINKSLIVLENKILSQDEKIDLSALRLGSHKLDSTISETVKIPSAVTNTIVDRSNLANESKTSSQFTSKPNFETQHISNMHRHSKKVILNADKLKRSPAELAALAKEIQSKLKPASVVQKPSLNLEGLQSLIEIKHQQSQLKTLSIRQSTCMHDKTIKTKPTSTQQQQEVKPLLTNDNLSTSTQLISDNFTKPLEFIQAKETQQPNTVQNAPRRSCRIITMPNISNPKKALKSEIGVKHNEYQKSKKSFTNAVEFSFIDRSSTLLATLTNSSDTMSTNKKCIQTPFDSEANLVANVKGPSVDNLTKCNTHPAIHSAVDFIAALTASNTITDHTAMELSPEELNLNATFTMGLSPLNDLIEETFKEKSTIEDVRRVDNCFIVNQVIPIGRILTLKDVDIQSPTESKSQQRHTAQDEGIETLDVDAPVSKEYISVQAVLDISLENYIERTNAGNKNYTNNESSKQMGNSLGVDMKDLNYTWVNVLNEAKHTKLKETTLANVIEVPNVPKLSTKTESIHLKEVGINRIKAGKINMVERATECLKHVIDKFTESEEILNQSSVNSQYQVASGPEITANTHLDKPPVADVSESNNEKFLNLIDYSSIFTGEDPIICKEKLIVEVNEPKHQISSESDTETPNNVVLFQRECIPTKPTPKINHFKKGKINLIECQKNITMQAVNTLEDNEVEVGPLNGIEGELPVPKSSAALVNSQDNLQPKPKCESENLINMTKKNTASEKNFMLSPTEKNTFLISTVTTKVEKSPFLETHLTPESSLKQKETTKPFHSPKRNLHDNSDKRISEETKKMEDPTLSIVTQIEEFERRGLKFGHEPVPFGNVDETKEKVHGSPIGIMSLMKPIEKCKYNNRRRNNDKFEREDNKDQIQTDTKTKIVIETTQKKPKPRKKIMKARPILVGKRTIKALADEYKEKLQKPGELNDKSECTKILAKHGTAKVLVNSKPNEVAKNQTSDELLFLIPKKTPKNKDRKQSSTILNMPVKDLHESTLLKPTKENGIWQDAGANEKGRYTFAKHPLTITSPKFLLDAYDDDTTKDDSSQDELSFGERKRFRKTLEQYSKKSQLVILNSDSDDNDNEFLGFDDTSILAGEADTKVQRMIKPSSSQNKNEMNIFYSPVHGCGRENVPLKKRWDVMKKESQAETDISDDTTPINDEDNYQQKAKRIKLKGQNSKFLLKTKGEAMIGDAQVESEQLQDLNTADVFKHQKTGINLDKDVTEVAGQRYELMKMADDEKNEKAVVNFEGNVENRKMFQKHKKNCVTTKHRNKEDFVKTFEAQSNTCERFTRSKNIKNSTKDTLYKKPSKGDEINIDENLQQLIAKSVNTKRKSVKVSDNKQKLSRFKKHTNSNDRESFLVREEILKNKSKPTFYQNNEFATLAIVNSRIDNQPTNVEKTRCRKSHSKVLVGNETLVTNTLNDNSVKSHRRKQADTKVDTKRRAPQCGNVTKNYTQSVRKRRLPGRMQQLSSDITSTTVELTKTTCHDTSTPKEQKKHGRKKKAKPELEESIYLEKVANTTKPIAEKTKKIVTSFNPRLLLIRKREQLLTDEVLTHKDSGKGPLLCGLCLMRTTKSSWTQHLAGHYGIGWTTGQKEIEINSRNAVLSAMTNFFRDTGVKCVSCRMCERDYRSALGLLIHIETCGEVQRRVECQFCKRTYTKLSLVVHERTCAGRLAPKLNFSPNDTLNIESLDTIMDPLNTLGRVKRASRLKAETKLRQIGKDLSTHNNTEFQAFDPMECIAYQAPIDEMVKVRSAWQEQLKNCGRAFCSEKICEFSAGTLDEMSVHLTQHSGFHLRAGYFCKSCKCHQAVFDTYEAAVAHAERIHKPQSDFESDASEYDISKDKESSDEYSSEGVESKDDEIPSDKDSDDDGSSLGRGGVADYTKCKSKVAVKFLRKTIPSTIHQRSLYPGRYKDVETLVSQKWKQFTLKHYAKNVLYPMALPSYNISPSKHLLAQYLPPATASMHYSYCNKEDIPTNFGSSKDAYVWQKITLYDNAHMKNEHLLYLGAAVKHLAWVPLPAAVKEQYLVCSYRKVLQYARFLLPLTKSTPNILFVVKVTQREGSVWQLETKILYGIQIPDGPVHCFELMPSGGYDKQNNRLGLLAVGCANRNIKIYALPLRLRTEESTNMPTVIDVIPTFVLTLDLQMQHESNTVALNGLYHELQCSQLCWSESNTHNYVVAGFSNGCIGFWDIDDKMDNLNRFVVDDLRHFIPVNCFYFGDKNIRFLTLHYDSNGLRWLAAGSMSRKYCVYDISNLQQPLLLCSENSKQVFGCFDWPILWETFSIGCSDILNNCASRVLAINPVGVLFSNTKVDHTLSSVRSLHYSPEMHLQAFGVDNGDVIFINSRELHLETTFQKNAQNHRAISMVDVQCLRSANSVDEEAIDNFKDFCQNYGLIFRPLIKVPHNKRNVYLSETRRPALNIMPYLRINAVRFNCNKPAHRWLAVGCENGFLRIVNFKRDAYF